MSFIVRNVSILWMLFAVAGGARSAEVHTNGAGGGAWSDPATWHGQRLPRPEDDVVVAMRDHLVFDLKDHAQPVCRNLLIDPEGALSFKTEAGKYTLVLSGSIESYGTLKMDVSRTPQCRCELRFVSRKNGGELRLLENSSLVVLGVRSAAEAPASGASNSSAAATFVPSNVMLSSVMLPSLPAAKTPRTVAATILANDNALLAIDRADLADVVLRLTALDNTGARPNERLAVTGCRLTGLSRLELNQCDTPAIRDNDFLRGEAPESFPAVRLVSCSLADCRGNRFRGAYTHALLAQNDTGSVFAGEAIDGPLTGVAWDGKDGVIRNFLIEHCATGIRLGAGTATVEDVRVDGAKFAFLADSSNGHQLTSCAATHVEKGGAGLVVDAASVTLLNSNIATDQIRLDRAPPAGLPYVQAMSYLIAKVANKKSTSTWVEVHTAPVSGGVPAGKADLNVRSSPAHVDDEGNTPAPRTTRSLIVRSWRIDPNKVRANAPFYDLTVMTRAAPGAAPQKLHTQLVEPSETWFQDDAARPRPIFEIKLP